MENINRKFQFPPPKRMTQQLMNPQETDKYINSIAQCRGVEGIVICSLDGIPIRSSMDEELTVLYAQTFAILAQKAQAFLKALDATDPLKIVRFRTQLHEVVLAVDQQFIMLTLQVPQIE